MILFETARLRCREAEEADIPWIIALESRADTRDYLWIGTPEEHRAEIADPKHLLLLFQEREGGEKAGYALVRLDFKSHVFELRRVATELRGRGYGREAMEGLLDYAFRRTDTNRFWLDVYPDNVIGIRLYESLGLHRDGVLRQSYKSERGYLDQIIYSLLRREYESREGTKYIQNGRTAR